MDIATESATINHAPASSAQAVFELVDACMDFGRVEALKNLDLQINEGDRVAVIGPSGAGKTTLFRLMAAVIKPTAGKVIALGKDTRNLKGRSLRQLRGEIGILYQNDNLIQHLRVVHNVLMGKLGKWMLPRALLSLLWPQDLSAAKAALREVELEEKLWSMPGELSGGQQQRVAIARLMIQQPRVMLADEPVSQLDMRLGREIITLLSGVARRMNTTLLVNLHTLDLLQVDRGRTHASGRSSSTSWNFSRVVAIRQGEVFWQGSTAEMTREMLKDLYGAEYRAMHLDDVEL